MVQRGSEVVGVQVVGSEVEARVLAEARRVAEAYGVAEGGEEFADALQGALDSFSEEEAEALYEYWGA